MSRTLLLPCIFLAVLLTGLYIAEWRKLERLPGTTLPSLEELDVRSSDAAWAPFYRVRATLLDGQRARLKIPEELMQAAGHPMRLSGYARYFGNGCRMLDDGRVAVRSFYLLPTSALVDACEIRPDIGMRWTLLVNLKAEWLMERSQMVGVGVTVEGRFRIDETRPYVDRKFFFK